MATIWNYPTRVRFGIGEAQNTGNEAKTLGANRVLVVTDRGVVAAGLAQRITDALTQVGLTVDVFDEIEPNPTEANIEAGARAFNEFGADLLVGVGGGSPLDAAKLISVRAAVALPFEALDDSKGGDRFIPQTLTPVIAVPTTAGTGSEVGRAAVLTVESTRRKTVVFSPAMMPKVAILDPELTRSMPQMTTAATGFDALTHCIEARVATGDHPMADAIADGGIELVVRYLQRAVSDGSDMEARGAMMKAALMGAVAFQKGLGACHSLAHPLSAEFGTHHGLANAVCLPAVVAFNLERAADEYTGAAAAFGARHVDELPAKLATFRAQLGLPDGLSAIGIPRADLPRLAGLAFEDACHHGNPRPCSVADLATLYEDSF